MEFQYFVSLPLSRAPHPARRKKWRELCICQTMTYLSTKRVLGYPQYTLWLHWRKRNRPNIRLAHMSSYRNRLRVRIVSKRQLQSDCTGQRLISTGMESWFVLPNEWVVQTVAPTSLQARPLYHSHYPTLGRPQNERRMCNSMRR